MQNKGTKIKLVLKSPVRRKTFFPKGYKRSSFGIDFRYLSSGKKKLCDFAYLSYETILSFVRFLKISNIHMDTQTVLSHDSYVWSGGKLASNIMFDQRIPTLLGDKNFISHK